LSVLGQGTRGVRRALTDSVSDSVVRDANCLVLVVSPEKEQAT
jgi:nucleotide-binding universal stress UspA family protein